jgi:HEPN domain-containing protein
MDGLFMNSSTANESMRWMQQAKEDQSAAEVIHRFELYNWSCFICQQAGEKAIKSFLYAKGSEDVWGHSLSDLCEDAIHFEPTFTMLKSIAVLLDKYYYLSRYPSQIPGGTSASIFSQQESDKALEISKEIIDFVQDRLDAN